jgi:hypothetical protein
MKFLQMQLQLDVKRFDSLGAAPPGDARLATLLNDNVLSSVGAYGLALQAMGEGKIASSLLPLQIRRERMWREKTKWFAAAAALVVLGTGVAVGRYYYDRMQYAAAEPQRNEIKRELVTAQGLASQWQEVEQAGDPEKKNIGSLQALTKFREVWPRIVADVDKALPDLNPADKATPRSKRPIVELEAMDAAYYEDLGPAVARSAPDGPFTMTQPEFITNASTTFGSGGVGGYRSTGRMSKVLVGLPATPGPGAGADAAAPAASKQRGYLLTLTCTTPMEPGSEHVSELVRQALLAETKSKGQEKQDFRIERVDFVSRVPLRNAPIINRVRTVPTGTRRIPYVRKYQPVGAAANNPAVMSGPANGLFGGAAVARNYPNRAGVRPNPAATTLRRPGSPEETPDQPVDEATLHPMPPLNFDAVNQQLYQPAFDPAHPTPIIDPVTGEDASTDNRLTFLVAVLLDPPLPAPPTAPNGEGAPPTAAGQQTASAIR